MDLTIVLTSAEIKGGATVLKVVGHHLKQFDPPPTFCEGGGGGGGET